MKVQAPNSLEPPMARFVMTFLIILGVTEICSFSLVLEEKTGKVIPK